jgi:hypothetical protein
VSRQQVGVLLLMFKAQRQVRLRRDAVEFVRLSHNSKRHFASYKIALDYHFG